ncbi:hypothetical protein ANN_21674 [Periplaneta americana]|uniref:Uncharacterized protein n=1 Tax=Periplaneta americana TaxID=6978 RepID=A0ABQ8S6F5_PERAM|nr:hypothetical protein ANN_21674 [Periplaneta americana]
MSCPSQTSGFYVPNYVSWRIVTEITVVHSGFAVIMTAVEFEVRVFKSSRVRLIFESDVNTQHGFLREGSKADVDKDRAKYWEETNSRSVFRKGTNGPSLAGKAPCKADVNNFKGKIVPGRGIDPGPLVERTSALPTELPRNST